MTRQMVSTLVPHLEELQIRLGADILKDSARSRVDALQLEQLPYCLGATFNALERILTAVAEVFASGTPHPGGIHIPPPDVRDILGFALDTFLESARRTQNALCCYVGKGLRISLPSSFADVVKRMDAPAPNVPAYLREQIGQYWKRSGAKLKAYRDLSQHYAVASSDVRLFIEEGGTPCLYLVLPNNPEVKSAASLVYEPPLIHGVAYAIDSFGALHALVYRVTRFLLDRAPPGSMMAGGTRLFTRAGLKIGEIYGMPMMDLPTLRRLLTEAAAYEGSNYCEDPRAPSCGT